MACFECDSFIRSNKLTMLIIHGRKFQLVDITGKLLVGRHSGNRLHGEKTAFYTLLFVVRLEGTYSTDCTLKCGNYLLYRFDSPSGVWRVFHRQKDAIDFAKVQSSSVWVVFC